MYLTAAFSGCLLSCIVFKYEIAIGASGAIFGLIGLEIVYMLGHFPILDRRRIFAFILVVPMSLFSFFDNQPEVDFSGHLGGLLVGITLGLAFLCEDSKSRMYKLINFLDLF